MLGLKRRRKVEGWAIDTSDTENGGMYASPWQRLADNNKIWIASFAFIVLVTIFFIKHADRALVVDQTPARGAKTADVGSCNDSEHSALATEFANDKSNAQVVAEARFLALDRFRIVVPSATSADDIEYVSQKAALRILHIFKCRPVVTVYMKDASDGSLNLVSTTRWESAKYGFVVKFKNRDNGTH